MLFFHYSQNNSGGGFDFDEDTGITHHVVIEAASPEEADRKLIELGGYFNGVESDMDCSCCGDRWNPAGDWNGREYPHVYGQDLTVPLTEEEKRRPAIKWMPEGKEVAVHHTDGRVEWHPAR